MLSIALDLILTFILPVISCRQIIDALVMVSVLFFNTLIRAYLHFSMNDGLLDLITVVFIPYLLISVVCQNQILYFVDSNEVLHTEMSVKNEEF